MFGRGVAQGVRDHPSGGQRKRLGAFSDGDLLYGSLEDVSMDIFV